MSQSKIIFHNIAKSSSFAFSQVLFCCLFLKEDVQNWKHNCILSQVPVLAVSWSPKLKSPDIQTDQDPETHTKVISLSQLNFTVPMPWAVFSTLVLQTPEYRHTHIQKK